MSNELPKQLDAMARYGKTVVLQFKNDDDAKSFFRSNGKAMGYAMVRNQYPPLPSLDFALKKGE